MSALSPSILSMTGFSTSVPGTAGPALLGAMSSAIVLTIADSDGRAVTGLTSKSFETVALILDREISESRSFVCEDVSEPAAGIYLLALPRHISRANSAVACVIDVTDEHKAISYGRSVVPLRE